MDEGGAQEVFGGAEDVRAKLEADPSLYRHTQCSTGAVPRAELLLQTPPSLSSKIRRADAVRSQFRVPAPCTCWEKAAGKGESSGEEKAEDEGAGRCE